MKKLLSLALCLTMLAGSFVACNRSFDNEDKGAVIPVYLATDIANFDPVYANLDDASGKILSLIYEGLFRIDEEGECVKAQAKSIKVLDDEKENYYAIEITLKDTAWSDGTKVQASDYLFAWERILEPEFRGEGASLLFDIKNARAVNCGDMTVADLGLSDVAEDVIRIEFERKINYDDFYKKLASIMLVPLRENAIDKVSADWSSNPTVLVTNGPFCVRNYSAGNSIVLERNAFYYRNAEKDWIQDSVKPYRLTISLSRGAEGALAAFEDGQLAYVSELPIARRAEYRDSNKAVVSDKSMSVMSLMFNTEKEPFNKPEVRKALSLVLDRTVIAEKLTFASPAAGLIANGVKDNDNTSFRKDGNRLISATADEQEAAQLLKKAGVTSGEFTITVRRGNEADLEIAEYVAGVWKKLGFKVTINKAALKPYKNADEYDLVQDEYLDAYETGAFDVILFDNQMIGIDAFNTLALYARAFAGGAMNMDLFDPDEEYELTPHISGYYNAVYDEKMEGAFAETDAVKRSELLHEAEAILMEDLPVIPLAELYQAYVVDDNLKKLGDTYDGFSVFTKAELKDESLYGEEA